MSTAATPERPETASDLGPPEAGEIAPKKASRQILLHEIEEGVTALERPAGALFLSALSAGLDIGFSLFLMAVMRSRAGGVLPEPVVLMLVANMYSVGFIFVVLGHARPDTPPGPNV